MPVLITSIKAYPFVKWAGGKRSLIPNIEKVLPKNFNDYYEPFVGGGSVFFSLADRIKKAYLSDLNAELISTYKVLKKDPKSLIKKLKQHKKNHNKKYYLKIRNQHNMEKIVNSAGRFIYLNKTCYNGLYRVNRSGEFNVPIGSYKNPKICDEENLLNVGHILKNTVLKIQSFERIKPKKGDLVYCDPPYDETFTSYTKNKFNSADQNKLKVYCDKWKKAGAYVIVSNNDTPFIRTLYKGWRFVKVKASRNINCKGQERNKTPELLILSY